MTERPGRLRWKIAFLLFSATVINYVDRQALSIAVPVLRDELGLSNTDYSRIVFAFLLAYTIMQSVSGRVMDRLGTRIGFAIFIAWWSAAAMLHGLANGALAFGFLRFLLGMGEAANWPGAVKAVAEWFPARERATATGFFNGGSSFGAVLAPPLLAWVILQFGWRAGFVATGAIGFLWLAVWLKVYQTPENHKGITAAELAEIRSDAGDQSHKKTSIPWIRLFRYRQLWALMIARILSDPVWWFYVFWLPEYLKRQRNFSLAMIGYYAWIPFFAAGVGSLIGGSLASHLLKRGWSLAASRRTVLLASAIGMIAGIPAVLSSTAAGSLAFVSIATFSYASWAAVFIALPPDIFPKNVVASVYGIAGSAAGLGGMLFTLIIGRVVDSGSYLPIFVAAGLLPLIATIALLLIIGPIEPIRLSAEEAPTAARSPLVVD